MKKVLVVVGARPNYMKAAPLLEAAAAAGIATSLVHTGQHYDPELSSLLMNDLGMKPPEHALGVGKGTPIGQIAAMLLGLEATCEKEKPDALVVVGDVSSTLAGAIVGNKLGVPLVHVEAGLRSRDPGMPEEWNRRATDLFSDLLFCTESAGVQNLLDEGKDDDQVFLVGNTMIDTLLKLLPRALEKRVSGEFGVLTLHRPSNVDDPERLRALLDGALLPLSRELPLVFPVHPRARARVEEALAGRPAPGLRLEKALGYVEFVGLMASARLVLTDSGGVQEETTVLGVPCLTVRENTERPVTVSAGTNRLVGTEPRAVLEAAREALASKKGEARRPPFWDGKAAPRAIAVLGGFLREGRAGAVRAAREVGALVGRAGR